MTNQDVISLLQGCREKLEKMSREEFIQIEKERGIFGKEYNKNDYTHEEIRIVLPYELDDSTSIYKANFVERFKLSEHHFHYIENNLSADIDISEENSIIGAA